MCSWFSDFRDAVSDAADDPKNYALLGALAGLGKAATPLPAPNGGGYRSVGRLKGLFGTLGDISGGMMGGAKAGQELEGRDIANQMAQLGLDKQQVLQPMQIQ